MKRIQSNRVELSLADIVSKFKFGKNATNMAMSTIVNGEAEGLAADATIVFIFETVKAEKSPSAKKTGRPRKNKTAPDAAASNAANGATA